LKGLCVEKKLNRTKKKIREKKERDDKNSIPPVVADGKSGNQKPKTILSSRGSPSCSSGEPAAPPKKKNKLSGGQITALGVGRVQWGTFPWGGVCTTGVQVHKMGGTKKKKRGQKFPDQKPPAKKNKDTSGNSDVPWTKERNRRQEKKREQRMEKAMPNST